MFDEFLKNCRLEDEIKPSEKRVEKNIASLKSLIGREEKNVAKRKFRLKPLIITAVIAIFSGVSLLSVSAAIQENTFNFTIGGSEVEGNFNDYVDSKGYRRVSFEAVLPIDAENYAIIYDVDAPQGENVRVITDDTDTDFMERLRHYIMESRQNSNFEDVQAEDFGLVFKNSEYCLFSWKFGSSGGSGGFGGKFMDTEIIKPNGFHEEFDYDYENGTKKLKQSFFYYVGKD